MTAGAPRVAVRPARRADTAALATFRCSTGAWFEDEVEDYIRTRAMGHAAAKDNYHLLVACEGPRILAVLGHADEALIFPDGDTSWAARLQVVAIATTDQGRQLSNAGRLSDVLMATLITAALREHETEVVTAIVAQENSRSIALCERNGLRSQVRYGRSYIRLSGRFTDNAGATR